MDPDGPERTLPSPRRGPVLSATFLMACPVHHLAEARAGGFGVKVEVATLQSCSMSAATTTVDSCRGRDAAAAPAAKWSRSSRRRAAAAAATLAAVPAVVASAC